MKIIFPEIDARLQATGLDVNNSMILSALLSRKTVYRTHAEGFQWVRADLKSVGYVKISENSKVLFSFHEGSESQECLVTLYPIGAANGLTWQVTATSMAVGVQEIKTLLRELAFRHFPELRDALRGRSLVCAKESIYGGFLNFETALRLCL
jgi:hypothetical protein